MGIAGMNLKEKKDFLSLANHSREEINALLDVTKKLKELHVRGERLTSLAGQTLVMIFEKASTRTRVSFEAGMTQLGGHAIFLANHTSQIGRGEDVEDTARVLSGYSDCIIIRTFAHKTATDLAAEASVPVINALTDLLHPCQVLADVFTMEEQIGSRKELAKSKVAYIGDGNNMANSLINAAAVCGFELSVATPEGHEPDDATVKNAREINRNITITRSPQEAAQGARVIHTDVWASMGQEDEAEARKKVFRPYQVNAELLEAAAPEAFVMHCLPAHKGEEITTEVFENNAEIIFTQAHNRLHAQKALLLYLIAPEAFNGL